MKRKLVALSIAVATVLLTSCASLIGTREVELPVSKLQAALDRKFPFNKRVLELVDVSATSPRLALVADTSRVVTTVDASLAPSFLSRSWKGTFTLSGVLALDQERRAVVITDPRLDRIAINGMDESTNGQIAKIGGMLASQMLKDLPLYTFGPEAFNYAGTRFIPTKIVTRSDALVVTFEPAR